MAHGPGKYDAECTAVQKSTGAEVVLIIALGGNRGSGFSAAFVTHDPARPPPAIYSVPSILRDVANQIEADQKQGDLNL